MIECKNCQYENEADEKICVRCGELLVKAALPTESLENTDYEEGTPRWGSARFQGFLVLDVLEEKRRFIFEAEEIESVDIGRKDPVNGVPQVDLSESGALQKGVSRRHASIIKRDGALHVMDLDSANGTYLNGQRLIAHQPRILRDGDDIRVGHLVLRVTFRPANTN